MTKKIYTIPLANVILWRTTCLLSLSPQPGINEAMTIGDGGDPMDGR